MKTNSVHILLSIFFIASCYSAQNEKQSDMIMLSCEGMPRAHIPTIVWFEGNTLPTIASDEEQDEFWKARYDAAPKFSLENNVYNKLKSLLSCASKDEGVYVLELLYNNKKSEIRYFDAKSFRLLREAIKSASIKGHEVLEGWPDGNVKEK